MSNSTSQIYKNLCAAVPQATTKNTRKDPKIALKVESQGQMAPKSNCLY